MLYKCAKMHCWLKNEGLDGTWCEIRNQDMTENWYHVESFLFV